MILTYILTILAIALPVIFFVNQATVAYYRKRSKAETKEMDKSVASLGCGIVFAWIAVVIVLVYTQFSYLDPVISHDDKPSPDSAILHSVRSESSGPSYDFDPYADTTAVQKHPADPESTAKPIAVTVTNNYPVYYDLHMIFAGRPSEQKIKSAIEGIMNRFEIPNTEGNVRKIASTLIELRRRSEVVDFSELRLAKHILDHANGGIDFDQQAAISAGTLGSSQLRNRNRKYEDPTQQQYPPTQAQY